jgi:hypothetical protein
MSDENALRDMLFDYEALLESKGAPVRRYLAPGVGRRQIEREFEKIGLVPNDELVTWFEWANGTVQPEDLPAGGPILPFIVNVSLEFAVDRYKRFRDSDDEFAMWAWREGWFGIEQSGYSLNVSCLGPPDQPPLVQNADPEGHEVGSEHNDHQVISLCTLVTYWAEAENYGASLWVPERRTWDVRVSNLPREFMGMLP